LRRFLDWAVGCQRPEGYWEQRYWLGGERAPSWCTHEDRLQIDQTAAVLFAMGRQRGEKAAQGWPSVRAAADYLIRSISPVTNLHLPAFDLWETFRGSFAYSNAAISCALEGAASRAREAGDEARAAQYEERGRAVRRAVMDWLWQGDYFARGVDLDGRVDTTADASTLGLITPFPFLHLDRPEERAMAAAMIDALGRRLGRVVAGGEMLLRFEGDTYAGGGPGITPTLWLVRALLCLAATDRDAEGLEACRSRAAASLCAVLSLGTPTGMLPEMAGPGPGELWAVPHAWSMASFVEAVVRLGELS
jgi:GH15 family glucan-1,4-alpha-glucosidase